MRVTSNLKILDLEEDEARDWKKWHLVITRADQIQFDPTENGIVTRK